MNNRRVLIIAREVTVSFPFAAVAKQPWNTQLRWHENRQSTRLDGTGDESVRRDGPRRLSAIFGRTFALFSKRY